MSAALPITLGASPHLSQAHRKGLGERASNRDFLALMDSLAGKDVATTKAEDAESASLSAMEPSASEAATLNSVLGNESGPPAEVGIPGYGSNAQSMALSAPRDVRGATGGERNPTIGLGAELQSLLFPVQQPNDAFGELPQSHDACTATAASPAVSPNSDEETNPSAFTNLADEMQLRVTQAASHFGSGPAVAREAAVQPKPSAAPSRGQQSAEMTVAGPIGAPSAEGGYPAVDAQASLGASLSPTDGNASPAVPIFGEVPLPLVPKALSEAVETLQTAQAEPGASVPEAVVHVSGAVTRELEIRLSPAGLGSLLVKMKLSGGAMSVMIQASKPSTLNAVENAREAIIERLAATNQVTASLLVKPLHVNETQPEDTNASSSGSAMREDTQGQADAGQKSPDRRGSKGAYRAPDQSGLGGARDFVL